MGISKRLVKTGMALALALGLGVVTVDILPPWWGKWAYMVHVYTKIPYAFGWPPKHFSGVWVDYYPDGGLRALGYKNGVRDGAQRYYSAAGKLLRVCEFRGGEPWSGLCDFWEYKPWLAEYRDGKVWKGAMQENDETQRAWVMRYYFEGKLYSESEFRRLMGFDNDCSLIGVMCLKNRTR